MRLRPTNPALAEARTVFPYRVIPVHEAKKVLYPASGNNKIGKGFFVIAKGKWRGVPIYTLTLEERAEKQREVAEILQELLEHYRGNAAK